MAGDTERLFVLLEARVSEFEKRMIAAERRGTQTFTKLRRDSASATGAMEENMARMGSRVNQALAPVSGRLGAVGVAFRGFLAGAAVTGLTMTVTRLGEIARGIAEIGDEAQRAGVSTQAFQEWAYVADQNRISVDSLTDGLKELNLRADEFVVTGGGSAAEAFQRLGFSAEELRTKLADPSALMLEIIDRLGDMDRAAQIRIADEVFGGTAGERFVELLDQGAEGIRSTIAEAHNLGAVMDDELIEKAADLDRMFSSIATTVGTTLKSAIVSAAASLVDFLRSWRSFDQQRSQSLEGQLNDTIRQRAQLVEEQKALQAADDGLSENARKLGFGTGSAVNQEKIGQLQEQIDGLTRTENQIIGVLQSRTVIPEPPEPASAPWSPPAGSSAGGGGRRVGGGGGRAAGDDFAERLERLTEELKTERQVVDDWYAGGQKTLADRRAAELLGEQGHQEARLALEKEYQERVAAIRASGNGTALGEAADFFGQMAEITSKGGNRLVRITRVLAAAEGLIRTYLAQTQVLADPSLGFFGKMAAYAAIGAAGLSAVAAIKGGGGSSGGGNKGSSSAKASGSSSGPAASTTSTRQSAPLDVRLQPIDPSALFSGKQLGDLLTALQREAGDRGLRLTVRP